MPLVVSSPAHGQVAIDAEGRFTYTPEADWNGTDSFTYKISDDHVDSKLATVTLTVTPVNDVPVIAACSVTLDEDDEKWPLFPGFFPLWFNCLSKNIPEGSKK